MNKWTLLLFLWLLAGESFCQDAGPWTQARYELLTARVERRGQDRGTAILLDRETGQTWIYVEEHDGTNLVNGWLELKRYGGGSITTDTTTEKVEENEGSR